MTAQRLLILRNTHQRQKACTLNPAWTSPPNPICLTRHYETQVRSWWRTQGGTDSAFLAFAAHRVLGDKMLAVIADSPSLPRKELESALNLCETLRIPIQILHTDELSDPKYQAERRQPAASTAKMSSLPVWNLLCEELHFAAIAFGMNTDDRGEHRPGQTAARNHHVIAPLVTSQSLEI